MQTAFDLAAPAAVGPMRPPVRRRTRRRFSALVIGLALDRFEPRLATSLPGWTVVDGHVVRTGRPLGGPRPRSDAQVEASAAAARDALEHLELSPGGRNRAAELLQRQPAQGSLFAGWL